ncbi:MAG: hypothetical protein QOI99_1080, partial [Actinomycetota bacterium]|nr:hypothetical protein [Actinomycetota bacterium]
MTAPPLAPRTDERTPAGWLLTRLGSVATEGAAAAERRRSPVGGSDARRASGDGADGDGADRGNGRDGNGSDGNGSGSDGNGGDVTGGDVRGQGLFISPADVDALLAGPVRTDGDEARGLVESCTDTGADAVPGDRCVTLRRIFGLEALDLAILLVALAPDVDRRFEGLYAYLNDDVTCRRPTVGLALELCGFSLAAPGA